MAWLVAPRLTLRRRLAFLGLVAGFVGATVSCAAVLGFERLSEEGGSDARSEASAPIEAGEASTSIDDPCRSLGVPEPPDAATGGADVPPLLGALRTLDFGIEIDGGPRPVPGLNLDRACSTDLATSSCTLDLLASKFDKHAKDKSPSGVDNAGYGLIQFIGAFSDTFNPGAFNRGIGEGQYGAVFRISLWNGEADDDDVRLEIFPSLGIEGDAGSPRFDENDSWQLDKRFQLGGAVDGSNIVSDRAWVSGGRLVARFGEVTLPLRIDDDPKPFDVHIRDAIVSGTIRQDVPLADGVVAGRWKTSEFLDQVKQIYIKKSLDLVDTLVCAPKAVGLYLGVKSQVCEGRDLRSDSKDHQGLACDAVSAGARIETYRVTSLGTFVPPIDAGARCVTGSAVPTNDDCE